MYIKRLRSDSLGRRSRFFSTAASGQQHPCFKNVFEGPCGGPGAGRTCGRDSGCRGIGENFHVCICRFDGMEIGPDMLCDKSQPDRNAPGPGCFKSPEIAGERAAGGTTGKFVIHPEKISSLSPDVAIVELSSASSSSTTGRKAASSTQNDQDRIVPSDTIRLNFSGFVPFHEPGKSVRQLPEKSAHTETTTVTVEVLISASAVVSIVIIFLGIFSRWRYKKHRSRGGVALEPFSDRGPALDTLIGRGTIVPNFTYDGGSSDLPELPLDTLRSPVRSSTTSNPATLQLTNIKYLSEKEISLEKEIGEGCFGKVFRGTYRPMPVGEPTTVAIKKLKQSPFGPGDTDEQDNELVHEADIIAGFSHKNILTLIGLVRPANPIESFWMVVEYLPQGDLVTLLRKSSKAFGDSTAPALRFSLADLHRMAAQVAAGMEYLASHHYIHRDLACRNCLVGDDLLVKISDFGLARDIYCCDYYRVNRSKVLPVRWMSPESIVYGKFSLASDVWAFGVVLWEIYSFGKQPYYGRTSEEAFRLIMDGVLLPVPENTPIHIAGIMKECWRTEPSNRTNFAEIVRLLKANEPSNNPSDCANAHRGHQPPELIISSAASGVTTTSSENSSSDDCGYLRPISSAGTGATYLDLLSDQSSTNGSA